MGKFYVASSLLNNFRARHFINLFEQKGHIITYNWTEHGQIVDSNNFKEIGEKERDGVINADLLFVVFPARSGTHIEIGIAIAKGIPIILLFNEMVEPKTFYYLDHVFRYYDEGPAIQHALRILNEHN